MVTFYHDQRTSSNREGIVTRKIRYDAGGSRLSRRERQIMDAVYRLGKATATEIVAGIPDPPTKDAIRRLIRILEEKGLLRHEVEGPRHVYYPTFPAEQARISALDHVIRTHFRGSISQAIAALIETSGQDLSEKDLERITSLIDEARKEGK